MHFEMCRDGFKPITHDMPSTYAWGKLFQTSKLLHDKSLYKHVKPNLTYTSYNEKKLNYG